MEKYFKNLLVGAKIYFQGNREISPGLQIIDLSSVPKNAFSLYVMGFPYLALNEEAAEKLKDFSEEGLKKLIAQKKKEYPDDVPILKKALSLKKDNKSQHNSP